MISYTKPLLLLFLSSLGPVGMAQDPDVSAARLLEGDSAQGPAAMDQEEPQIAQGGGGFLVVWSDLRTSTNTFIPDQSARDILAARLDATGQVLDTTPIQIATTFGEQEQPRVAWNGTNWLVTWENQSPTQFFYASAVQGVRVAPDGDVLDPTPIDILVYDFSSTLDYGLASNGSGWAVVAQASSAGESDLIGARIAADGTVLDPGGKLILSIPQLVLGIRLSFAVDTYLVIYSHFNRIKGIRMDGALNVAGGQPTNIGPGTGSEVFPNLGTDGSDFFVVWESSNVIQGTRFTRGGQVLDPGGLTLNTNGFTSGRDPAVGWDGSQWVVLYRNHSVFNNDDGLDAVRVTNDGQVLDFDGVPLSMLQASSPALVDDPSTGVRFVWRDGRSQGARPYDVFTSSLDTSLAEATEAAVALSAPAQLEPDLAAGPGEYLVAFKSVRPGLDTIVVQRVDRFGNSLDEEPIFVSAGLRLGAPRVAWNGTYYLVVWADEAIDLLYGMRFDALAQPVDPFPTFLMAGHQPDVAAEGSQFLVVGWDDPTSTQIRNVYATRVDAATGASLDLVAPLLIGSSYASRPRVESLGGRYVATWQRNFSHDDGNADVRFVFVETDGTKSSETVAASFVYSPDVLAGDSSALLVWGDGTGYTSNEDLFARRIDVTGSFLDGAPFVLSSGSGNQVFPTGAWTGAEWLATWSDQRDEVVFFDEREDVFGARVAASGSVVDTAGFELWRSDAPTAWAAVASLETGTALVAAQTMRADSPLGAYRVELRVVGAWAETGAGIAGTNGVPVLDGTGRLEVGETLEVSVSNARSLAAGVYVYAFSRIDFPLFGGTLVPAVEGLLGFTTDVAGTHTQLSAVSSPATAGAQLFVQAWVIDPQAPQGFAASPAVTTVAN